MLASFSCSARTAPTYLYMGHGPRLNGGGILMDQTLAVELDIAREYLDQQVAQEMKRYYELLGDDVPAKIFETAKS